jgi:outer membrane biosynthesis protein TonB
MQLSRSTLTIALVCMGSAIAASPIVANTETVFPRANRILKPVVPAECREWRAPLPDRKTNVDYPQDAPGIRGSAALLVKIGKAGEYLGVVDFIASDDSYMKAADTAMKAWTFRPALCNGDEIASEARVDFEFRREGGVSFQTGPSSRRY